MGTPDLTYDSERLANLSTQMGTISGNLHDDRDLKSYDVEEVGHHKVADAIDDFVNDWDDKRNKLIEKVDALAEMASTSHENFTQVDLDLAAALTTEEQ